MFFYKEKNKDIRAAAYLRLSIEDGDKAESNSIGNQRELIRDFAAERPGLHLIEEYADDGYTGTNFERPGFKRMMEDIKSGKINCIIVKVSPIRFSRPESPVNQGIFRAYCVTGARLFLMRSAACLRVIRFRQTGQYLTLLEVDAKNAPHSVHFFLSPVW